MSSGRGQKLAAALQRKKEAEQARSQTPAVPGGTTGQPPVPPIPASRQSSRPQTPTVSVGTTSQPPVPPIPASRQSSRPQTPAVTVGTTSQPQAPPIPASRQSSRPQTPSVPPAGRGRAALLAKARMLTGLPIGLEEGRAETRLTPHLNKSQHDNQSEMSFRSEDFETSSRIGAVGGVPAVRAS